MKHKATRQQGFTLLEVMIALTVFAIISALAWQILDGAMRTTHATDRHSAALNQLQRTWNLLDRDFFQLEARAPRDSTDKFIQTGEDLEFTTLSGISGQLQLERVAWRLHDHQLWRNIWPVLDAPGENKPDEVPVLEGVKDMTWRFYRQGWLDKWSESDHLPDGVELTLTMDSGETWRWVFTTPGELPESAAANEEAKPTGQESVSKPDDHPLAKKAIEAEIEKKRAEQ